MLLRGSSVSVWKLIKVKKNWEKRCMLPVTSSKLSSTMSFLRTFRTSNPQTISPQVKRAKLTLITVYTKCTDFLEFTSLFSYCDALPPNSTKSWQPKKFTKHSHPLFLIVNSSVFLVLKSSLAVSISLVIWTFQKKHGCSNLMKHPLVISLLDYKWKKFGRYIFFGNMFVYLIFLAFLTAFGLVVLSPVERPYKHVLCKIFYACMDEVVHCGGVYVNKNTVYGCLWICNRIARILWSFTHSLQRVDVKCFVNQCFGLRR